MKRIQPYYFLIALAALFLIGGLFLFMMRHFPSTLQKGAPVEPKILLHDNSLYEFWFANADLYDLSVDRNVTGILFSSSAKKVSLLDRERRLRWEKNFHTEPLQAKISACGNYLAVGTAGGNLFFMSTNQQLWWEKELGDPVYQLTVSANGKWVAAGQGRQDSPEHRLDLYDQNGVLKSSIETGPLLKVFLVGEQPDQGRIFFSWLKGDTVITAAASLEGELLWSQEDAALAAISRTGNRLAAVQGRKLVIFNHLGQFLWEETLPFKITALTFNPQNHSILVYGDGEGGFANFYSFNDAGDLLWQKRIADGSLFAFTADGRRIITSSWRHYKDDFSRMVLYDENGDELNRWEVAIRVEYLVVAGNRRFVVLGGEDGYIDLIDLEAQPGRAENTAPAPPFYSPVVVKPADDQSWVTLYFYETSYLVPVARSISQTENRIRAAIDELIRGPARDSALYRTIPDKEMQIEVRFNQETGQLTLELPPELAQVAGAAQSISILDSLRLTMAQFAEIREIFLTVAHKPIEIFGDGLSLEQPLLPYRWRQPVFIPVRLGERYYLVPREARELEIEQRDLDGLLQAVVRKCRALYFIPGDLRLLGVQIAAGSVKINVNSSLKMLFPEKGGEEEKLQAALLLEALFLTAFENSSFGNLEILVEGESWIPPQGYPSLSRVFHRPYYLNPEL
jgi:spore germination protein GerM